MEQQQGLENKTISGNFQYKSIQSLGYSIEFIKFAFVTSSMNFGEYISWTTRLSTYILMWNSISDLGVIDKSGAEYHKRPAPLVTWKPVSED